MVRVTVTGDDLAGFAPKGTAEHIRVFFPLPGRDTILLPDWGPNGPIFPPGEERPVSRAYTPRRWDPDRLELDIDFVLHGEGPGSSWAEVAKAGDAVVIAGPGGAYQPDPEAEWFLLAGDEAAIPAIGTIVDALPRSVGGQVYIEVEDETDEMPLNAPPQMQVTWLHRGEEQAAAGALLQQAVQAASMPERTGRVWVGCEADVMRRIRKHLLYERGLDKGTIHTQGYWKRGATNHPDHDVGDDV
jgi:NADPH-dependent ferric siderophore reductase